MKKKINSWFKVLVWLLIFSILIPYFKTASNWVYQQAYATGVPVITSVSPTSIKMNQVSSGSILTINGVNLLPEEGETLTVKIGNKTAGIVQNTDNRITCVIPEQDKWGTYKVVLEYSKGGSVVRRSNDDISFQYISNPQVSNVTPLEGPGFGGTYVIIEGENFDPSGVTVKFGNRNGLTPLVDAAGKRIVVYTPAVPMSEVGTVLGITVTNKDGGTVTTQPSEENKYFRYRLSQPQIISVVKEGGGSLEGSKYGGTRLIIEGKEIQKEVVVMIGSHEAIKEKVETRIEGNEVITKITLTTPGIGSEPLGAKQIKVINPYDGQEAIADDYFTYYSTPYISSINPWQWIVDEIPDGGLEVFITGENFAPGLTLMLDDKYPLTVKEVTSGTIKAVIPKGSYPTGHALNLTVANPGDPKDKYTKIGAFTFLSQHSNPTITKISPNIGPISGGTKVTIEGSQFMDLGNVKVRFGDKYGEVISSLPDKLVVVAPANNLGIVDVYVENSDGGTAYMPGGFKYKDKLVNITGLVPSEFWIDRVENILIYVTNLANKPNPSASTENEVKEVRIVISRLQPNGQLAEMELDNSQFSYFPESGTVSQITATTKLKDYFSVPESFWNVDADFNTYVKYGDDFEELITLSGAVRFKTPPSSPVINKVYDSITGQNFGPLSGGNQVYIEGEGFSDSQSNRIKVYFGSTQVPKENIGHLKLENGKTIIPVQVPPAAQTGLVPVWVENPDGGRSPFYYGYIYREGELVADLITPDNMTVGEEIEAVITGRNFAQYLTETPQGYTSLEDYLKSNTRVLIGDTYMAEILSITDREIIIKIPKITVEGEYKVTVENPYGRAECSNKFKVLPFISKPVIEGVSPGLGSRLGGVEITITGKDFRTGARVEIGGQAAVNVRVISSTEIKAVTPPGQVGATTVKVINPDGGSAEYLFTYLSQPGIEQITPTKLVVNKISFVTLIGSDLIFKGIGDTEETLQVETVKLSGQDVDIYDWKKVNGKDVLLLRVTAEIADQVGKRLDLTIENKDGGTITLAKALEIVPPSTDPKVIRIEPNEGSCYEETDALLYGSSLMPGLKVYFVDPVTKVAREAKVESVNEAGSIVKIKTPVFPLAVGQDELQVDVTVMNIDRPGSFTLEKAFTYKKPALSPIVSAIYPAEGPTSGGIPVTVTGWNFTVDRDKEEGKKLPKLYFVDTQGLKEASAVTVWDENDQEISTEGSGKVQGVKIKAIIPPNTPGVKDVVVVNPDTGIGRLNAAFTYKTVKDLPELNLIIPSRGPDIGGQKVNLYGAKFQQGAKVLFGTKSALNVKVINEGNIELTTPSGTIGKVDVTVINPDGGSSVLVGGYEYTATVPSNELPAINAVVPGVGSTAGGTEITVYGKNFKPVSPAGEKIILYVGSGVATEVKIYKYDSSNQLVEVTEPDDRGTLIKAKTPRGKAGTTYVAVLNPDGGYFVLENCFTYKDGLVSKPVLTSIIPDKGRLDGGTPIQLEGTNVEKGAKLYIGDREATSVQVIELGMGENGNKNVLITAFTPQGTLGVKDVTVVNPDGGSYILSNGFTYLPNPANNPRITSINPNQGRTTGGTDVTISGSGFKTGQLVFIGGRIAPTSSIMSDAINLKTPPGEAGPKDVYVVDPNDGGLAFMPNGFEYVNIGGPTITKVEPNKGLTKGGERITITGTNFDQGASVKIGGTSAQVVSQLGTTTIIVLTPEKDIGTYDVEVINPDGTNAVLTNGFTYYGAPKTPGGLNVTPISGDGTSLKIEWDEVVGADYYELYGRRRSDDGYQFLASTKETYYYVTGLEPDTWYSFKVRAVNRYGASAESSSDWNYTYYRSWNSTPSANATGKALFQNGIVSYTLGSSELSGSSAQYYTIDLSSYTEAKVHCLNIPASLVDSYSQRIFLKTDFVHLKFYPRAFYTSEFRQVYPNYGDTYAKVEIAKLSGGDEERLLKYLPPKMTQVSPIIKISATASSKHKDAAILSFSQSVSLGLTGDSKKVGSYMYTYQTYYFNQARGAWEPVGSKTTWYGTPSELTTVRPGYYVLLAEKR